MTQTCRSTLQGLRVLTAERLGFRMHMSIRALCICLHMTGRWRSQTTPPARQGGAVAWEEEGSAVAAVEEREVVVAGSAEAVSVAELDSAAAEGSEAKAVGLGVAEQTRCRSETAASHLPFLASPAPPS